MGAVLEDGREVLAEDEEGPRLIAAPDPAPTAVQDRAEEPNIVEPQAEGLHGSIVSFKVGGKAPTSSSLRLTGGAIEGDFADLEKGQTLRLLVEIRVDDVGFKDLIDPKTRQVIGCEKRFKALIMAPPKRS